MKAWVVETFLNTLLNLQKNAPKRSQTSKKNSISNKAYCETRIRMVKDRIIKKVDAPALISNHMITVKQNGKIRICIDPFDLTKFCYVDIFL